MSEKEMLDICLVAIMLIVCVYLYINKHDDNDNTSLKAT